MRMLLIVSLLVARTACAGEPLPRTAILPGALATAEGVWRGAERTPPRVASRDLFSAALTWCEAVTNLDRLAPAFKLAASMQDRDTNSATYGNFLWSTMQTNLLDKNAVDFCMQTAAVLWLKHRDRMPPEARALLQELVRHGAEGQLRHRVKDEYTNIALMAAVNLILLGEGMSRPDLLAEGKARLDAFEAATRRHGTHEFVSPTYYGVDLDDLVLLEAHTRDDLLREQARRLLLLFWTDIAANWFPPAGKLAGPRSRDYDYVRGLGILDHHLVANGWLPAAATNPVTTLFPYFTQWRPPSSLLRFSETCLPRRVEQNWGPASNHFRQCVLWPDVALGVAGAGYGGRMDLPLTIDFPGDRREARGYFIPDGRRDPYGKQKILERSGHEKTLHLQPFWAAGQRDADALGLAVYRTNDVTPECVDLLSHFVLPARHDGLWLGDERIEQGSSKELPPGGAFFIRKGTAAAGIRVPLAIAADGGSARTRLHFDTGFRDAFRLTVEHGIKRASGVHPAAAFWVRVGSGLKDEEAFAGWRKQFMGADVSQVKDGKLLRVTVAGLAGPVSVSATEPYTSAATIIPAPRRAVLAVNGEDLGARILDRR